jgi:alanyl-tRNA synthetase
MLGDGIIPSNVKAGYLARLVLRRTLRMMKDLNISIPLSEIVQMHIKNLPEYPEFAERFEVIEDILHHEEIKFQETLERGRRMISKSAKHYKQTGQKIPLETIIEMYDTHGIPPEISKEVADKEGVKVDLPDNFYSLVAERHSKAEEKEEKVFPYADRVSRLPPTKRLFYDEPTRMEFEAVVLDLFDNYIVCDSTFFYPEGGGQPADHGVFIVDDVVLKVVDVQMVKGVIVHRIDSMENELHLRKGDIVIGKVDKDRRMAHACHHTATHIVNDAARKVLGDHIWQAGAQKTETRARLDITHYKRITKEQLNQIELLANKTVMENQRVTAEWMERNQAEQKYGFGLYQGGVPKGNIIRVLKVADDIEACGGTHCTNTGLVGPIKILKTERIQDGVERIEYAAGMAAVRAIQESDYYLTRASDSLRVLPEQLPATIERFFTEWKEYKKENARLKEEIAQLRVEKMLSMAQDLGGVRLVAQHVDHADTEELVKMAGELTQADDVMALLISDFNGVKIVAAAGKKAVAQGVDAGIVVREMSRIVGGGGGGRPDMARGGGDNTAKIGEAMEKGISMIEKAINH